MIKLIQTNLHKKIKIERTSIIDNNLYILYYDDFREDQSVFTTTINLIKINLTTKEISDKHVTSIYIKDFENIDIIDDKIYLMCENTMFIYDLDCIMIKFIRSSVLNVLKLDKIYYLKKDYNLVDEDDNILLIININSNSNYIKDNNVYINGNGEDFEILFLTFKNYIIFIKKYRKYCNEILFIYDIKTKQIIKFNYFCRILGNGKFIYDVKRHDNKLKYELYVFDLSRINSENNNLQTYKLQDYLINKTYITFFNLCCDLKGDYYLTFDKYEYELILYLDININTEIINNKDIKNIIIGTNEKQVEIPINLLLENSEYIKNLFNDFNEIPAKLIHNSFENIEIYCEFLKNKNIEELCGLIKYNGNYKRSLFELCNFMIDKNLFFVSEKIIEQLDYTDNFDINDSFKYMELFSTSIYSNNIDRIFYIILKKYEINMILTKIYDIDKESKLFKYCINEFVKYSTNNIKKNSFLFFNEF